MPDQNHSNILNVALVNIHGQSGLDKSKQMQIETFLQHNNFDILHLQEINILEDTAIIYHHATASCPTIVQQNMVLQAW